MSRVISARTVPDGQTPSQTLTILYGTPYANTDGVVGLGGYTAIWDYSAGKWMDGAMELDVPLLAYGASGQAADVSAYLSIAAYNSNPRQGGTLALNGQETSAGVLDLSVPLASLKYVADATLLDYLDKLQALTGSVTETTASAQESAANAATSADDSATSAADADTKAGAAAASARAAQDTATGLQGQVGRIGPIETQAAYGYTYDGVAIVAGFEGEQTERMPMQIDANGRILIPLLQVGNALHEASPEVAWGVMGESGGLALWVDLAGNVHAPLLVGGSGGGGTTAYPTAYVGEGDSITEGLQDSNFNHAPGHGYPAYLAVMLGLAVINKGISSQTSSEIAARHGAPGYLSTFQAGSGGAVTLTSAWGPLLSLVSRTQVGRLGDIRGTLSRTVDLSSSSANNNALAPRGDRYSFAPDAGQPTIRAGLDLVWLPDNPDLDTPHILMTGRNDPEAAVLQRNQAILSTLTDRALQASMIMGTTYTTGDTAGTQGRVTVTALNASSAQAFPRLFFNPNLILCRDKNGGYTDTPNTDWMADTTHPNHIGYKLLAFCIQLFIQSRRYPTVSEFTSFVGAAA